MSTTTTTTTIAVDVGGTHTDAVLVTRSGTTFVSKVKSTPKEPERAFMESVSMLLGQSGLAPADIDTIVHGTTIATNAVINGNLARVGLITTNGFKDVLRIGTQRRADLYDLWRPKAQPLVPPSLTFQVAERVAADGHVVTSLSSADVEAAARAMEGRVDAVAISFLFSFANPHNEQLAAEIVAAAMPGVPISVSSEVAPEIKEFERTSTTVVNAALQREVTSYLDALERELIEAGFVCPFLIMTSNAGVVPVAIAKRYPVNLLVSGPAAGAVSAAYLGERAGYPDVIMLDVGGTSADIALVEGGQPQRRFSGDIRDGVPVNVPQVDVVPIGAGGGSLARVDRYGSLLVGPESAGAAPGPAAYGIGEEPTVTDAHLVIGTLDPTAFLGGALALYPDRAATSVAKISQSLGTQLQAGAGSIIRVVDSHMANAMRMVTVQHGFDIRDCALVAMGGAGPLHACGIAADLDISTVIFPRHPGLTSALGLVISDGRFDVNRSHVARLADMDREHVNRVLHEMELSMQDALSHWDGGGFQVELKLDLRYTGQAYQLTVPVSKSRIDEEVIDEAHVRFRELHRRVYGHAWEDRGLELVTLRLQGTVPTPDPVWTTPDAARSAEKDVVSRSVWTDDGAIQYAVRPRASVRIGDAGPVIYEQFDSTIVVPPGWSVVASDAYSTVVRRIDKEERP